MCLLAWQELLPLKQDLTEVLQFLCTQHFLLRLSCLKSHVILFRIWPFPCDHMAIPSLVVPSWSYSLSRLSSLFVCQSIPQANNPAITHPLHSLLQVRISMHRLLKVINSYFLCRSQMMLFYWAIAQPILRAWVCLGICSAKSCFVGAMTDGHFEACIAYVDSHLMKCIILLGKERAALRLFLPMEIPAFVGIAANMQWPYSELVKQHATLIKWMAWKL